jgi:hypothetical protein
MLHNNKEKVKKYDWGFIVEDLEKIYLNILKLQRNNYD